MTLILQQKSTQVFQDFSDIEALEKILDTLPKPVAKCYEPHLIDREWKSLVYGHTGSIAMASDFAANQKARIHGDPHVEEADGGKFDFQGEPGKTYHLFSDKGVTINARFQSDGGRTDVTTMGEIGMSFTDRGCRTSNVQINPKRTPPVTVNNTPLRPGQKIMLADGGKIELSQDGRKVSATSAEGYQHTVLLQGQGENAYLDYDVISPTHGVTSDGQKPGGLLGHTFDEDTVARNGKKGKGAQGEGAIDGIYTDYEVPTGIFGKPQPPVVPTANIPNFSGYTMRDPAYQDYFGLPQGASPELMDPDYIQQQWNQILQDQQTQQQTSKTIGEASDESSKIKKMEMLLKMALASGNMDMAMILISGLESHSANKLMGQIMLSIRELQKQRQGLAEQMTKKGAKPEEATKLNNQMGDIGTEISLLQTLLQDLNGQKTEAQQLSSNYIKSRHDTASAILRNI